MLEETDGSPGMAGGGIVSYSENLRVQDIIRALPTSTSRGLHAPRSREVLFAGIRRVLRKDNRRDGKWNTERTCYDLGTLVAQK